MDDNPTLADWSQEWLKEIRKLEEEGILRHQTVLAYERCVRLHFTGIDHYRLGELRMPLLLTWAKAHRDAGAARKSLVLRVAVLKVCLRDAKAEGYIDSNPAERLIASMRLPKAKKVQRWFSTMEQAAAFLAQAEAGEEWCGVALMAYTGLRIGEATGLRWECVDLEGRRIVVRHQVTPQGHVTEPKSASGERFVDIPEVLVEVLQSQRVRQREAALRLRKQPTKWVLGIEPAHNSAGRGRLRKAMVKALKAAGLPHLTPHGLRHSWISFRALLGQDGPLITAQAGHSDPRMTQEYIHLQRSDPEAAEDLADSIRPRQRRLFGRAKTPA